MLNKVQRLSCLSITGAIKSMPEAGLKIMVDIPTLDVFIKNIVTKFVLFLIEAAN